MEQFAYIVTALCLLILLTHVRNKIR